MKVRDFISYLKNLPQDVECVYSIDDEGNEYKKVEYVPCVGLFCKGEFKHIDDVLEYGENTEGWTEAVCIN